MSTRRTLLSPSGRSSHRRPSGRPPRTSRAYVEGIRAAPRARSTRRDPTGSRRSSSSATSAVARCSSCGNGGSAAIANHLECDHLKGVRSGTDLAPGSRASAATSRSLRLSPTTSCTTRSSPTSCNLRHARETFCVAISSSGRSPNIMRALLWAAERRPRARSRSRASTAARHGSPPRLFSTSTASNYGVIEDTHQAIMHTLAQYIRQSRMTHDGDLVNHVLGQAADTLMRVAINLLTEDPANPSGAHWFWTRVIPEMAKKLRDRRRVPPARKPEVAAAPRGLRTQRLLHHLPVVEQAARTSHAYRAPLHAHALAGRPHRRVQHHDGAAREPDVVARHPHEDNARLQRTRLVEAACRVSTAA